MSNKKNKRFKKFNAICGIAAMSVVSFTPNTSILLAFYMKQYNVPFFFIISGFVIYLTINNYKSAYDFAWSRFIRVYPFFLVYIPIYYLLSIFTFRLNG